MMRKRHLPVLLLAVLAAGSAREVLAQDAPRRPWSLQTDFGLVNTAGNTSTTTLNVGEAAEFTTGAWTFGQTFEAVYGKTGGAKSAESYLAALRGDYTFAPRVGVYVMGGWNRNRFAGISRRFEEGTGLMFKAIATERSTLTLEAGVGANQQRDLAGATNNFMSGRGALRLKQHFATRAYFQQLLEVLPNFKTSRDVRLNSETALVAPLSQRIAFKAGYVVRFDNLPEPGFKKTDRYLTSGLQVVF